MYQDHHSEDHDQNAPLWDDKTVEWYVAEYGDHISNAMTIHHAGLKTEDHLLDIGCGTLRGGIPIIRYLEKGHYYGIEILPDVLEEGKKELLESKLTDKEPVLLSGSISSVNIEIEFNYIWAFSLLIHLTNEILDDCFDFVSSRLSKQGKFYATVNIGDKKDKTDRIHKNSTKKCKRELINFRLLRK